MKKPTRLMLLACLLSISSLATAVLKQTYGTTFWMEEKQLTYGSGSDSWPIVTQQPDGAIWLVFVSDKAGNPAIYLMSSRDGDTWTTAQMLVEEDIATIGINIQRPSLLVDSKGTTWIAWQSQRSLSGGDAEIWYITSGDAGTTWSEPKKPYAGDSPWNGYYDPFVVEAFSKIWIFFQHYSNGHDMIWCFSSDDEGNTWSSKIAITSTSNSRGHPSCILIGSELLLTYDSAMSSSPSYPEADIYLMKTTDGSAWSSEKQLITIPGTEQFPSIAKNASDTLCLFFDYSRDSERSIRYISSTDGGSSWSISEILTDGLTEVGRSPGITASTIGNRLWVVYSDNNKIRLKSAIATPNPDPIPIWMQWWLWAIAGLCVTSIASASLAFRYRRRVKTSNMTPESEKVKSRSSTSQKTCSNCGAQLPEDSEFCGKCGKKLE